MCVDLKAQAPAITEILLLLTDFGVTPFNCPFINISVKFVIIGHINNCQIMWIPVFKNENGISL